MPRTPLVAVSGSLEKDESRSFLNTDYFLALHHAGLVPVMVSPHMTQAESEALLARVDGLLFAGGDDLDPTLYGEAHNPHIGQLEPLRDQCECMLLRGAYARRMPVLGICRGIQVLAVGCGGTLWQDLPAQTGAEPAAHRPENYAPCHPVEIYAGTRLETILGAGTRTVNSWHHQAVKDTALRVAARSPDGLIEAVERPESRFFVGVQWHPELLEGLEIFRALTEACR